MSVELGCAVVDTARDEFLRMVRLCRPSRLRTMREFAEQEVVIPDGQFKGLRYRTSRQPYSVHWFDAIENGLWREFWACGPTQSGKTLTCFIIPILYHLFEYEETVICGLPDMDMAKDKWSEDLLPAIEATDFRELIPSTGGGSRGGKVESIKFKNGATLKFMSSGGGDKSRAAFTSRVAVLTEVDGMDESSSASREADPVSQIKARTMSYGARARIYGECTTSIPSGRIWQEYTGGTESRILSLCRHCGIYVFLEREHLIGFSEAQNEVEAFDQAFFACRNCGAPWSEDDRFHGVSNSVLVHGGEAVRAELDVEGVPICSDVKGELVSAIAPKTFSFGFRWSGIDNMFRHAGDLARLEWKALDAFDEDNELKQLNQFCWALPYESGGIDLSDLDADALASRMGDSPHGVIPEGAEYVTATMDLGATMCHWSALAWLRDGSSVVFDYGAIDVPRAEMGLDSALTVVMRQFLDILRLGWPVGKVGVDDLRGPDLAGIDSAWKGETVYEFLREVKADETITIKILPIHGLGESQAQERKYLQPKDKNKSVKTIGDGWHLTRDKAAKIDLVWVNSDRWKSFTHARLGSKVGDPGAMVFYRSKGRKPHQTIARHILAEHEVRQFKAGVGEITIWIRDGKRANHYFDTIYINCILGNICGVRVAGAGVEYGASIMGAKKKRGGSALARKAAKGSRR